VAFVLGGFIVAGWAGLEWHLTHSPEARMAKATAALEHGVNRTYDVVGMQASVEQGNAIVQAYGPDGVEKLRVYWGALAPINPWITPSAPGGADAADSESSP
jgi:hypothetical protein